LQFDGWYNVEPSSIPGRFVLGQRISTDLELPVTFTRDSTIVAHFTTIQYRVDWRIRGNGNIVNENATPNNPDIGCCYEGGSGAGAFAGWENINCNNSDWANERIARPKLDDPCSIFIGWEWNGEMISTQNTLPRRPITAPTTITAVFGARTYTLTTSNSTGGTVEVTGGTSTITCGENATRTLRAVPATNCYKFARWSDGNTEISRSITVTSDTTITATFELIEYDVTISADPVAGGTVSSSGGKYDCGATVSVTATANTGFRFRNWTSGTTVISTSPQLSIVVASDTSLVAHFVSDSIPFFNVTATVTPTGSGTVSNQGSYERNDTATLRATPTSADYSFYYWNNDRNNTNPVLTIVVTKDTAVVAHFRSTTTSVFEVTLNVNPAGKGTVEGEGDYELNATATLKATSSDECYVFERWSDGNTDAERTIVVTKDTNLTANFALIQYNLNVSVSTGGGGTVSPAGVSKQDCGTIVPVTATANANYKFVNWTNEAGTTIVSTERALNVTMARDTTLVAHFEVDPGNIAEVIKSGAINIMPNPTSDDFVVSFDVLEPSNNMQIFLTDLTGRQVLHIYDDFVESGLFTKSVKTNNLARGVYFLHVRLNGNVATEKITLE